MSDQDDCTCDDDELKIQVCCYLCSLTWTRRMIFLERLAICPLHQHRICSIDDCNSQSTLCASCHSKQTSF